MRDILFRGKSYTDNKWHYGYLFYQFSTPVCPERYEITDGAGLGWNCPKETIGQFTGLCDKDDKKIFEGDIVSGTAYSNERVGVIVWIKELAGFGVRYRQRGDPTAWGEASILKDIAVHKYSEFSAKIIGNIYDSPGLLGARE